MTPEAWLSLVVALVGAVQALVLFVLVDVKADVRELRNYIMPPAPAKAHRA